MKVYPFILYVIYCLLPLRRINKGSYMLLPIEEVYRERTFDELMEDEFTRLLFDSISSCEEELDFRDSFPSYISAENQYAILFNTTYYIINEARLNPRPHLRIKEYESYVDGLKYPYLLKSEIYKEIIFTIVYYLASNILRLDENFCRKIKLRASQYVHNLLFYVSPYSQAYDLVDAILPSPNLDSSSKKDIELSTSECHSLADVIDDLESQIKDLKNTIREQKECISQLESKQNQYIAEDDLEDTDPEEMNTAQLIILFEVLLNVPLSTTYTNLSALSKFIARVSKYKSGAIRTKINEINHKNGYENPEVRKNAEKLIEWLQPIGKEKELSVVGKIRKNLEI